MDALITVVELVAIWALTFLAFKHHSSFRILGCVLLGAMVVWLIGAAIWDVGGLYGVQAVMKFADVSRLQEARASSHEAKLLSFPIFVLFTAISTFMIFLFYLPTLLGGVEPKRK